MKLLELIKNPKLLSEERNKLPQAICAYCEVPLQGAITGKNPSPKGICCDDCYYAELGKFING